MPTPPKPIDLTKLEPSALRNYFANNMREASKNAAGQDAARVAAQNALLEMTRRGIAKKVDFKHLPWRQESIKSLLLPFEKVASLVSGNERTAYTEAGGKKIGRSKDDPDRMWIDTYSAIKTAKLNAVFVCYIKNPGDEPEFRLRVDDTPVEVFNADNLDKALEKWKQIAARAL